MIQTNILRGIISAVSPIGYTKLVIEKLVPPSRKKSGQTFVIRDGVIFNWEGKYASCICGDYITISIDNLHFLNRGEIRIFATCLIDIDIDLSKIACGTLLHKINIDVQRCENVKKCNDIIEHCFIPRGEAIFSGPLYISNLRYCYYVKMNIISDDRPLILHSIDQFDIRALNYLPRIFIDSIQANHIVKSKFE